VKLSHLHAPGAFALLGPGFGDATWRWFADLAPSALDAPSSPPRLFALPFEAQPEQAIVLTGDVARFADLELDVAPPPLSPELDAHAHRAGVERIRHAIAAGDVYQVNFTLRATVPGVSGAELVAALCRRGVPRFLAWVRLPDGRELVSASPELFFERSGARIRVEPMKGTAAPAEAHRLERSTKDRAELAMITDLMRNDLTPLCAPRSVAVTFPRRQLALSYAVQTVSDVEGELLPGITTAQILRALHPGGSVTGAPKRAALEMIRALEPTPRGFYCGALGLIEGAHTTASLLIRTATRTAPGWSYGVGGGIVWESEPDLELAEIHIKLGALR
jgi:anthranilate/para-aminobenzoate synthase component I